MSERDLSETFPNNYLSSVSFEVRFPPLLEIQTRIPKFQKGIRERFPNIRKGFPIAKIGMGTFPFDSDDEGVEWAFISEDQKNQVKTNINRCAVITTEYDSYESLLEMVRFVIDEFSEVTEIDEYSRIGLRYVNEMPLPNKMSPSEEVLKYFNPIIDHERIMNEEPFRFQTEYRVRHKDNLVLTSRNGLGGNEKTGYTYLIDIDSFVAESKTPHSDLTDFANRLHNTVTNVV